LISGVVSEDRQPLIRIALRNSAGNETRFDAIVDTGYTGWLTMPETLIGAAGLAWRERAGGVLADGSDSVFDVYDGTVVWDGRPAAIPVDAVGDQPLVGMSLMYGYELTLPVLDGATFELRLIAGQ
jgi:clan AA aspartic protease